MITSAIPATWQDLERGVARILAECGFRVETKKATASARGSVELDVYAEESVRGRRYAIACECKHWRSRIPQHVVHSFRTVVSEVGANIGYIISMEGFQSGSITASELTNIKLVTWREFQDLFEESWFETFFMNEVDRELSGLMSWIEPFVPAWWDEMSEPDRYELFRLRAEYEPFGMLMQSFGPYLRRLQPHPIPTLPLRLRLTAEPDLASIPAPILDEIALREFLAMAVQHGRAALEEFRLLKVKYVADAQ